LPSPRKKPADSSVLGVPVWQAVQLVLCATCSFLLQRRARDLAHLSKNFGKPLSVLAAGNALDGHCLLVSRGTKFSD